MCLNVVLIAWEHNAARRLSLKPLYEHRLYDVANWLDETSDLYNSLHTNPPLCLNLPDAALVMRRHPHTVGNAELLQMKPSEYLQIFTYWNLRSFSVSFTCQALFRVAAEPPSVTLTFHQLQGSFCVINYNLWPFWHAFLPRIEMFQLRLWYDFFLQASRSESSLWIKHRTLYPVQMCTVCTTRPCMKHRCRCRIWWQSLPVWYRMLVLCMFAICTHTHTYTNTHT